MIKLIRNRLVGVLYDWLRVILSFQGTAPIMGGFKGGVSYLISKLKVLNLPGRRGGLKV